MPDPRQPRDGQSPHARDERDERLETLHELEQWLERPMLVLGFVWLGLLVLELTRGLSPLLEILGTAIWVAFIADFVLRLWLAPDRGDFLRRNWLGALSLLVPALRVLRVVRVLRVARAARVLSGAARGGRVVRVVGSINRGMRSLGRSFARRGFGYVVTLTALVTIAGAAGMYAFERTVPDGRIGSFGEALWWTAMIMTTMGSEYWPRTPEGRALCVILALYAFAVFGYVTATLATYFVGRDAADPDAEVAGSARVDALRDEIAMLRAELAAVRRAVAPTESIPAPPGTPSRSDER